MNKFPMNYFCVEEYFFNNIMVVTPNHVNIERKKTRVEIDFWYRKVNEPLNFPAGVFAIYEIKVNKISTIEYEDVIQEMWHVIVKSLNAIYE